MSTRRCINCMKMIDEETDFCPHCGYGQKEEPSPFGVKPGTILRGRYLVGRTLGQGGFGLTYVGYDLTLDIRVAIKEYFPSGSATRNNTVSNQVKWNTSQFNGEQWRAGCESFLKEARRMAKTDLLPGIVRVRDTFPENQTAYIVMDFVEGETLKQRLAKTGPMKVTECLRLLRPLMEGLGKMHGQGLIHRDISPDNIMVQPEGSVCLLDFGAAKDISFQQTAASQQVAKKGFSPPEQYRERGSIGSWTDVYALCATIYYCITGKLLPDAMERLYEDTLDFEVFLSEPIDANVINVLRDGLKLRPEERIRTVEELLERFDGTEKAGDRKDAEAGGTDRKEDTRENLQEDREVLRINQEKPQGGSAALSKGEEKAPENAVQDQKAQPTVVSGTGQWRKKISKKMAVLAAAAVMTLLLLVIKLIPNSGREDADIVQQTVASDQTESEQSVDTGRPESVEETDGAGETGAALTEEESETSETLHILMGDDSCEYSEDDGKYYGTVLGSEIDRNKIVAVQFVDTLDGMADGAWDVSAGQDGTVMAWTKPNVSDSQMLDLMIGAEGKITAENCSGLFKGYYNVEEIDFNGCFDTSRVTDMLGMFGRCESLTQLDLDGFDTSRVTEMGGMFNGCSGLTRLDVSGFETSQVMNMKNMFRYCGNLTQLDVSGFDTNRVTDMERMFYGCESLTQLDVSGFNTRRVTSMCGMFCNCKSLTQLDVSGFNTSRVTDMYGMFDTCESLTQLDVSGFDTRQVTDMRSVFSRCYNLTQLDVRGFDTGRVTSMQAMFGDCKKLTQLDVGGFDTSQVTDMSWMFNGCESLTQLDVSGFNTSQVTNMKQMFDNCSSLTQLEVGGFDTSQATIIEHMFCGCKSLTQLEVGGFDTSQVTSMGNMFYGCSSLTELDVSGFDTGQVTNMDGMFDGCGVTAEEAGLKTE